MRHQRKRCAVALTLLAVFVLGGTSLGYEIHCCPVEHDEHSCSDTIEQDEHCHYIVVRVRLFAVTGSRGKDVSRVLCTPNDLYTATDLMRDASSGGQSAWPGADKIREAEPPLFLLHSSFLA